MDFLVQFAGLIFLAASWSGPATSASIFSAFLDYILRVCQSLRDSFFYLGKLHWLLYLLLSYYYDSGMFIFCWSSNFVRAWRRRWDLVSPTLYRMNLNKLLRNFVGTLHNVRATATNCRVSFIDFYLVFGRNFRNWNRIVATIVVLSQSLGYLWFVQSFLNHPLAKHL